ncbi:MAG: S-methyl-5-thioribose-1-phosphate isomerase [Herpetosiphonaceae bacterium]|nr:S-methyl-5-thioribose-1-phosphate isomerase [Herpetosiphonaceae bacterium]
MTTYASLEWRDGVLRMLDQRYIPHRIEYLDLRDQHEVAEAIREMVVRGAPAIGATAAYGLVLAAQRSSAHDVAALRRDLMEAAELLRAARPTAVNLGWAVERVLDRATDPKLEDVDALRAAVLQEAQAIAEEDEQTNRQMGLHALPLIPQEARFIHHCNTGSLATVAYGTALGIIRTAHEHGKAKHVFVDETRPRFQGSRLTAWELEQLGIPYTIIMDSASGHVMRTLGVDLCVVGCDRVARNGDTANKIGTYNLAVVARAHNVPFYVAAPTSTIDLTMSNGNLIVIEERPAREVTHVGDEHITMDGARVANPAFDITPAAFITAIVTEMGIAYPPYDESLPRLVALAEERRTR